MAIVLKDRVKQSAAAPGTGTITLGATPAGFQAFSAIGNGNVTYFAIVDSSSGAWEVNYGTYTSSGTTLSRNATPLSSSAAGALVNFTGAVDVFCTYPASKSIYEETSGNVLIDGGPITVIGTGVTSYTTFSAALGELYANLNNFAQFYAQNLSNGSDASADIVAYNNLGDGVNNFIDMGINSSNYTSAVYPIFTASSGYVYNDGGELIIGTATATKDVLLFAGGVATTNWAARISGTNQSITTKAGLTVGGALTGVGGSFTAPVTTTSSMTSPGSTELVTRTYVDGAVSTGFVVHPAVRAATPAGQNLGVIYNNGTAGVGATITADTNRAFTAIDGVAGWSVGQRLLVKNQTSSFQNGIYTLTNLGVNGVSPWVATRATDFDTAAAGEIANNAYVYVTSGTTQAGSSWVLAQLAAITVGTTALPFDQFASSLVYTGGTNIDVSGQVISLTGTVAATNGGTGTSTVTTGDLLYGSATDTWSKLPKGAAYRSLIMDASATNVEWNAVALNQANAVSGALGATNGGTGQSTYTLGDTLYSSAANTLAKLAGNTTTTKKFLVQTGTGAVSAAPVWDVVNGADVNGNITGQAGSVANALTLGTYLTGTSYNGGTAVTATVDATSANTASKVVARDVSGNFSAGTITAALSGNATTATTATNVAGGTANQIVYNTSAGTTSFAAAPSASGQVLGWNGSAFAWTTTIATATTATTATNQSGGTVSATTGAFSGNVVISTTDNTNAALRITQLGTGNALLVEDESNPDSSPFVINADGRVMSGTTTILTASDSLIPRLALYNGQYGSFRYLNDNSGNSLLFNKSRGTGTTQTIVQSSDFLGYINFAGSDGTNFISSARIEANVDGTPGTNDMPGRLVFSTTADGASSPTERMRIDSAGNVGIGLTPAANNGILQVSSYASIKALLETATVTASAPAATTNFDVITQAVQYYTTNASANFTFNIRGNSGTTLNTIMAAGQSCTLALMVTNGGTAYRPTVFQVDGAAVTPKWQGGTAPAAGNASSIDVYVFTVIKTASATFTVLASQTKFA